MTLAIRLLGNPAIDREDDDAYRIRSQKSWAVLAYLLFADHPPARTQLASLLFAEADDPLRALRWSLSELRLALGDGASIDGDPVALRLPPDTRTDIDLLLHGDWREAAALPGLGATLLESLVVRDAPVFESWLVAHQHQVAAASEAVLHEAALGSSSLGRDDHAIGFAARLVGMNPLDENHQALLLRLYRRAGDDRAAARQLAACTKLFAEELGVPPGQAVAAAMSDRATPESPPLDAAAIVASIESGSATVAAGSTDAGIESLRTAVAAADLGDHGRLQVTARMALAEALIHSLRGQDEEGCAFLVEAVNLATHTGEPELEAEARAELGYVDFLRARYDRAERWLTEALQTADRDIGLAAKATAYLGSVASDRGDYPEAVRLLDESIELSRSAGATRMEAYSLTMLGRVALLRGELDQAELHLESSIDIGETDRWLAFLPFPQALLGEVHVARGNNDHAFSLLSQAFARACQLGDPCWEGMTQLSLGLHAEAAGRPAEAFELLTDARSRCNRLADPYVWLDGRILDALAGCGVRHGHDDTAIWVEAQLAVASRTSMKELVVRALLHRSSLAGSPAADIDAARMMSLDVDNPILAELLARTHG